MKKLRSRKENNDWLGDTVDDCLNKFKKIFWMILSSRQTKFRCCVTGCVKS